MNWLTDKPFAHRGLHGPHNGYIENSLSAFNAAIIQGYGFELDVLLSKDNKAIVIHDKTLERLTDMSGALIDFNASDIQKFYLSGSKDHIPTLKEVLELTDKKTSILIEIKGDQGCFPELSEAVYNDIKNYTGNVAIMSFYPEIIRNFHIHHPSIKRGLVATSINDHVMPNSLFSQDLQINTINDLDVDFIAYDIKALPNKTSKYCQQNNIPVLTWTVRSADDREHVEKHTDNIIFEL